MLRYIEQRLNTFLIPPDEDGFVYEPTELAIEQVNYFVIQVILDLHVNILNPIIAPDGNGGLKFDWRKSLGEEEIRLYLSGTDVEKSYLYINLDGEDKVIKPFLRSNVLYYLYRLAD